MLSFFIKRASTAVASRRVMIPSPCLFQVITWPPGIKTKSEEGRVIHHKPLSTMEAKRIFESRWRAENQRVEILGHAAAKFHINLQHPAMDPEFRTLILDVTARNGINHQKLEQVLAYISWFPAESRENAEKVIDFDGKLKKLLDDHQRKVVHPDDIIRTNRLVSEFFAAEVKAINSCWEDDIYQYGEPSLERVITLEGEMDYRAVFLSAINMMKPSLSEDNKVLLLNQTMSNATYFGLDILRIFVRFLGNSDQLSNSKIMELMHPNHVCTTSVLRLILAAIGDEACKKIAQETVKKHPELTTAGLPLVEFTHYFSKAVAKQYSLVPIATSMPGLTR